MSKEFEELFNQSLSHTREQRVHDAKVASKAVLDYLNALELDDQFKSSFFFIFIGIFTGVDGVVDQSEVDIFNEIFSTDFTANQLVKDISKVCTQENIQIIDNIVDSMPKDVKLHACILALAVISSDGKIDEDESALFEKLLA